MNRWVTVKCQRAHGWESARMQTVILPPSTYIGHEETEIRENEKDVLAYGEDGIKYQMMHTSKDLK